MPSHYIVVDLEATCSDDGSILSNEQEIIEIGAVAIDTKKKAVLGEFQTFVRPVKHPTLTKFCTSLTTISQEQIDQAPAFAEAYGRFAAWFWSMPAPGLASWGSWDWHQLLHECHCNGIPFGFAEHLNIPRVLRCKCGTSRKNLAYRMFGITPEGTRHRGIDDARNYAKILIAMLAKGLL